jgi:AcrR family transcriptional regulator
VTKKPLTKEEVDRRFEEMLGKDGDDSPSARKRRRILRAAYELFRTHGYRKTSIDDVARKAEVAKGTVYLYFPNKGQLLVAAVALEKATMRDQIARFFDGSIPKHERLHHYLTMSLRASRDLPLVSRLLAGDGELLAALEDAGHDEAVSRTEEGLEFVASLIEDAAPGRLDDDEKRRRAEAVLAVAMASTRLVERLLPGRTLDQLATTIADMLVHGVAGKPKKR